MLNQLLWGSDTREPADRLPLPARKKLELIRRYRDEAHHLSDGYNAELWDLMEERNEERAVLKNLLLPETAGGRGADGDHPDVVRKTKIVNVLQGKISSMQSRLKEIAKDRTAVSRLATAVEDYVLKAGKLEVFKFKPSVPIKGDGAAALVERIRSDKEQLDLKLKTAREAPIPSSQAKKIIRQQLTKLAAQAKPGLNSLLYSSGEVSWPAKSDTYMVEGLAQPGPIGMVWVKTPLVVPLLAAACQEQFLRFIDSEIDAAANDKVALSDAERAGAERTLTEQMLVLEREEEAVIEAAEAAGSRILRRADADPRAVLGVA